MTTPYPEAPEDGPFNYRQTQNLCTQTAAALGSGGKVTTTSSKTATGCSSSVVVQQYELTGGHPQVVRSEYGRAAGDLDATV